MELPVLSVVIPAYNEAQRLPETLSRVQEYLSQQPYRSEIIIADDGSSDETATIAGAFPGVHVLRRPHFGKGATVRAGILAARGSYILVSDADLAVPIADWDKLAVYLQRGYDVVIGSREGMGAQREQEPWLRHLMGRGFNLLVRSLVIPGIRDTQCGFKAFRKDAAQHLFALMQLYRDESRPLEGPAVTAYDVEILFLAARYGYRIAEIPVEWHYGEGSKVRVIRDAWRNLRDIAQVRLNAWRGLYPERRPATPAGAEKESLYEQIAA